jgi:DNA polymerase III subunit epsilon
MELRRYVICDIEATGLEADREMIEIALITYQDGKITEVYDTRINPLRPISAFIQEFTSISARELEAAPKFYDVAEAIRLRLEGAIFVSHNTDFDYTLLKKKFAEMGQELELKTFCTLKVAQEVVPGLRNYNLDALCSFFDIKIHDRHTAIGDARATLELFRELGNLRHSQRPVERYLPRHEKYLKHIPARAGLLSLLDESGRLLRLEVSHNMHQLARSLLLVAPKNRELLERTETLSFELTGSALIAEFLKLGHGQRKLHWMIAVKVEAGTKMLELQRLRKTHTGLFYFATYPEARKKLRQLERQLAPEKYVYRDTERTKDEILQQNRKIDSLIKETAFPAENLVLLGEGRELRDRSLVLIRRGHVVGHGYTEASEAEIYADPERFLTQRYSRNLSVDLAAKRYLRELRNLRHKKEGWRGLTARL